MSNTRMNASTYINWEIIENWHLSFCRALWLSMAEYTRQSCCRLKPWWMNSTIRAHPMLGNMRSKVSCSNSNGRRIPGQCVCTIWPISTTSTFGSSTFPPLKSPSTSDGTPWVSFNGVSSMSHCGLPMRDFPKTFLAFSGTRSHSWLRSLESGSSLSSIRITWTRWVEN